jgi:hypothetical protein
MAPMMIAQQEAKLIFIVNKMGLPNNGEAELLPLNLKK